MAQEQKKVRAWVTMRGSRTPKQLRRDAGPSSSNPHSSYAYAALSVHSPKGEFASFELGYYVASDGRPVVELTRYDSREGSRRVFAEVVGSLADAPSDAPPLSTADAAEAFEGKERES